MHLLSRRLLLLVVLSGAAEARVQNDGRHQVPWANRVEPGGRGGPRRQIHLAGIFPIDGVEGWQGGQVRSIQYEMRPLTRARLDLFFLYLFLCL